MKKCDCYNNLGTYPRCYGTKERERCTCNGDESLCNFYPEKIEKATANLTTKNTSYEVSIVVSGYYYVTVEANSPEEAKEKANIAFKEANIGDIKYVDWFVQDAKGNDGSWTDFI